MTFNLQQLFIVCCFHYYFGTGIWPVFWLWPLLCFLGDLKIIQVDMKVIYMTSRSSSLRDLKKFTFGISIWIGVSLEKLAS